MKKHFKGINSDILVKINLFNSHICHHLICVKHIGGSQSAGERIHSIEAKRYNYQYQGHLAHHCKAAGESNTTVRGHGQDGVSWWGEEDNYSKTKLQQVPFS